MGTVSLAQNFDCVIRERFKKYENFMLTVSKHGVGAPLLTEIKLGSIPKRSA
jgi:hypothetical protein